MNQSNPHANSSRLRASAAPRFGRHGHRVLWRAISFFVFVSAQNIFPQSYTVTDVGWPGNVANSGSEAHGINRSNSVVGTWYDGNSARQGGNQYAFLYANGTNKDLGTIKSGGYDYAVANAINNAAQVVGQGTSGGGGGYTYHAFLYTNGVMVDLDNTSQGWSSANAINQRGQIVGEFTTPLGFIHAFIYTNGTMLDLGTLPGGTYSTAMGINDSGVIVGQSSDASGNSYAFVYSNNVMTSLGTLGGNSSIAYGINNSGVIVGQSDTTNGESHAFVYRNGTMSDIGTLGGTNSTATAINNGGLIIGYALTTNQDAHAFSFGGSAMLDLHTSFPPPTGWTNIFLTLAYAVNDAGKIVGGVNYITNGITNYDAFILTPPSLALTCSTNITTVAPSLDGAAVFFNLTATGGCSSANIIATPPSGSLFPVGTNTVNVTASDLCGHTNTCSFTVVVYPPLTISCSTNITMQATDAGGAVVNYSVTASGGCSAPTVSAIPASGSLFPIGTNTVNATASDSCGDTNSCSFTVTVYPQLTVSCSTNITARASDSNGAQVFFNFSASGGCSSPSITANPPSGSTFAIGTNTVTVTANDTCGNTNTCAFTVTVAPPLTPMTITSQTVSPESGMQMTIQGTAGQRFSILASPDLVNWTWLITNTLISNSTNFTDAISATNNSRFYRAATLP